MMNEDQIQRLIESPHALLTLEFQEEDWKEIYTYLKSHRMTDHLLTKWVLNQEEHGYYRYKAIGQLFARFATIGRGFSTIEKAMEQKMSSDSQK